MCSQLLYELKQQCQRSLDANEELEGLVRDKTRQPEQQIIAVLRSKQRFLKSNSKIDQQLFEHPLFQISSQIAGFAFAHTNWLLNNRY